MQELALRGGPKAKPTPYTQTNRYGDEELAQLKRAIDSGRLMGPGGLVEEFEVDELQRTVIRLPIDQRYTDRDIDETIAGIRKVWAHYMG